MVKMTIWQIKATKKRRKSVRKSSNVQIAKLGIFSDPDSVKSVGYLPEPEPQHTFAYLGNEGLHVDQVILQAAKGLHDERHFRPARLDTKKDR
jgi:hypothetical protein